MSTHEPPSTAYLILYCLIIYFSFFQFDIIDNDYEGLDRQRYLGIKCVIKCVIKMNKKTLTEVFLKIVTS